MKLALKAHKWLRAKPVQRVFAALPKDSTRFVGGCVRDALLGERVSDIDLATQLEPKQVAKLMKRLGIAVHETGIEHGTLTLVADNQVFEITTLRRDVSTDGRRASIAFTQDWEEDAKRRDFTINALYCDLDGKIYDPLGQGLEDIKDRRIRFVGDAHKRIKEDYLRILRFFRFAAWISPEGKLDKDGLRACRELKAGLKTLSSERIWSETKKLLGAKNPARIVHIMLVGGILETLLPEASNAEGLGLICDLEQEKSLTPDPELRLMAMSARDEMAIARLCKRLKMSNSEKKRFMRWAQDSTLLSTNMDKKQLAQACYNGGRQTIMDRLVLRAAGARNSVQKNLWWRNYEFAKNWQRPEFPLTGKDLIAAGFEAGEGMGRLLKALEALWVRSGFTTSKQQLLLAANLIAVKK